MIETKQVKKIGYGAHILVPKKYIGQHLQVVFPDEKTDKYITESEIITIQKKLEDRISKIEAFLQDHANNQF